MSERIYYCNTDLAALSSGNRGWPENPVYFHTQGGVGHVSANDFRDITIYSLEDFQDNCGVVLIYTSNPKTANLLMRGRDIDGRGKVLANSGLPIGLKRNSDTVITQNYDSELFSSEEVAPQGKISMPAVIRHECGHGIGALEHAPDNSGALMRPFIDPKVSKLQAWDIRELQKIYGPSKRGQVPPSSPPASPADGELILRIRGRFDSIDIPGYRVTKLDR